MMKVPSRQLKTVEENLLTVVHVAVRRQKLTVGLEYINGITVKCSDCSFRSFFLRT